MAGEATIGRKNGTSQSRNEGPTPHDINQRDSSAEFGMVGSPTICGKEVKRLQEVPGRSTNPMGRRAQVIDRGAGGRD